MLFCCNFITTLQGALVALQKRLQLAVHQGFIKSGLSDECVGKNN